MKKLGIMMAAAMILAGTATYATTKPAHPVKTATEKTTVAQQEKTTTAKTQKKAHKKHHAKKATTAPAPKAK